MRSHCGATAAHRAGHLLWQPLRQNDPMSWSQSAVDTLWAKVATLLQTAYPGRSYEKLHGHDEL